MRPPLYRHAALYCCTVVPQVEANTRLEELLAHEHTVLEQIFPRHVIEYFTLQGGASPMATTAASQHQPGAAGGSGGAPATGAASALALGMGDGSVTFRPPGCGDAAGGRQCSSVIGATATGAAVRPAAKGAAGGSALAAPGAALALRRNLSSQVRLL